MDNFYKINTNYWQSLNVNGEVFDDYKLSSNPNHNGIDIITTSLQGGGTNITFRTNVTTEQSLLLKHTYTNTLPTIANIQSIIPTTNPVSIEKNLLEQNYLLSQNIDSNRYLCVFTSSENDLQFTLLDSNNNLVKNINFIKLGLVLKEEASLNQNILYYVYFVDLQNLTGVSYYVSFNDNPISNVAFIPTALKDSESLVPTKNAVLQLFKSFVIGGNGFAPLVIYQAVAENTAPTLPANCTISNIDDLQTLSNLQSWTLQPLAPTLSLPYVFASIINLINDTNTVTFAPARLVANLNGSSITGYPPIRIYISSITNVQPSLPTSVTISVVNNVFTLSSIGDWSLNPIDPTPNNPYIFTAYVASVSDTNVVTFSNISLADQWELTVGILFPYIQSIVTAGIDINITRGSGGTSNTLILNNILGKPPIPLFFLSNSVTAPTTPVNVTQTRNSTTNFSNLTNIPSGWSVVLSNVTSTNQYLYISYPASIDNVTNIVTYNTPVLINQYTQITQTAIPSTPLYSLTNSTTAPLAPIGVTSIIENGVYKLANVPLLWRVEPYDTTVSNRYLWVSVPFSVTLIGSDNVVVYTSPILIDTYAPPTPVVGTKSFNFYIYTLSLNQPPTPTSGNAIVSNETQVLTPPTNWFLDVPTNTDNNNIWYSKATSIDEPTGNILSWSQPTIPKFYNFVPTVKNVNAIGQTVTTTLFIDNPTDTFTIGNYSLSVHLIGSYKYKSGAINYLDNAIWNVPSTLVNDVNTFTQSLLTFINENITNGVFTFTVSNYKSTSRSFTLSITALDVNIDSITLNDIYLSYDFQIWTSGTNYPTNSYVYFYVTENNISFLKSFFTLSGTNASNNTIAPNSTVSNNPFTSTQIAPIYNYNLQNDVFTSNLNQNSYYGIDAYKVSINKEIKKSTKLESYSLDILQPNLENNIYEKSTIDLKQNKLQTDLIVDNRLSNIFEKLSNQNNYTTTRLENTFRTTNNNTVMELVPQVGYNQSGLSIIAITANRTFNENELINSRFVLSAIAYTNNTANVIELNFNITSNNATFGVAETLYLTIDQQLPRNLSFEDFSQSNKNKVRLEVLQICNLILNFSNNDDGSYTYSKNKFLNIKNKENGISPFLTTLIRFKNELLENSSGIGKINIIDVIFDDAIFYLNIIYQMIDNSTEINFTKSLGTIHTNDIHTYINNTNNLFIECKYGKDNVSDISFYIDPFRDILTSQSIYNSGRIKTTQIPQNYVKTSGNLSTLPITINNTGGLYLGDINSNNLEISRFNSKDINTLTTLRNYGWIFADVSYDGLNQEQVILYKTFLNSQSVLNAKKTLGGASNSDYTTTIFTNAEYDLTYIEGDSRRMYAINKNVWFAKRSNYTPNDFGILTIIKNGTESFTIDFTNVNFSFQDGTSPLEYFRSFSIIQDGGFNDTYILFSAVGLGDAGKPYTLFLCQINSNNTITYLSKSIVPSAFGIDVYADCSDGIDYYFINANGDLYYCYINQITSQISLPRLLVTQFVIIDDSSDLKLSANNGRVVLTIIKEYTLSNYKSDINVYYNGNVTTYNNISIPINDFNLNNSYYFANVNTVISTYSISNFINRITLSNIYGITLNGNMSNKQINLDSNGNVLNGVGYYTNGILSTVNIANITAIPPITIYYLSNDGINAPTVPTNITITNTNGIETLSQLPAGWSLLPSPLTSVNQYLYASLTNSKNNTTNIVTFNTPIIINNNNLSNGVSTTIIYYLSNDNVNTPTVPTNITVTNTNGIETLSQLPAGWSLLPSPLTSTNQYLYASYITNIDKVTNIVTFKNPTIVLTFNGGAVGNYLFNGDNAYTNGATLSNTNGNVNIKGMSIPNIIGLSNNSSYSIGNSNTNAVTINQANEIISKEVLTSPLIIANQYEGTVVRSPLNEEYFLNQAGSMLYKNTTASPNTFTVVANPFQFRTVNAICNIVKRGQINYPYGILIAYLSGQGQIRFRFSFSNDGINLTTVDTNEVTPSFSFSGGGTAYVNQVTEIDAYIDSNNKIRVLLSGLTTSTTITNGQRTFIEMSFTYNVAGTNIDSTYNYYLATGATLTANAKYVFDSNFNVAYITFKEGSSPSLFKLSNGVVSTIGVLSSISGDTIDSIETTYDGTIIVAVTDAGYVGYVDSLGFHAVGKLDAGIIQSFGVFMTDNYNIKLFASEGNVFYRINIGLGKLEVFINVTLQIPSQIKDSTGSFGTNGQVLKINANGIVQWSNP